MALAGAFALGFRAFDDQAAAPEPAPVSTFHHGPIFGYGTIPITEQSSRPPLALEQVRLALAQAYYRHVSPLVLAEPTIAKILERLDDEYTEYLSPGQFARFQGLLDQGYNGIGLTLDLEENGLIVTRSLAGPARAAGIRAGDVIVSIDGKEAATLPFDRSLALFDGKEGTKVRVTVQRPGHAKALDFELVRGPVAVSPVRTRIMKTGGTRLGYIRLLAFTEDAAKRVGLATRNLVERGAKGFILDLRGDPGGYLTQAVAVSSLFLDSGVVCQTRGVNQETRSYRVSGAPVETERPLVVLVDGTTASAAEIVAGALRDNERAVLVGKRTYGKATVQSVIALSNGGALKLTTATYVTPSGSSIGGRGIKPKVKAVDDKSTRPDEAVVAAAGVVLEKLSAAKERPDKKTADPAA